MQMQVPEYIKKLHLSITRKSPIDDKEFDAWYTNRQHVFQTLLELGQSIAKKLREDLKLLWSKGVPENILKLLQAENVAPVNWEDSPEGVLTGIVIILAGWLANQTTGKTLDCPKDVAREIFQKHIRPLIIASMDLGTKMAESERKQKTSR